MNYCGKCLVNDKGEERTLTITMTDVMTNKITNVLFFYRMYQILSTQMKVINEEQI